MNSKKVDTASVPDRVFEAFLTRLRDAALPEDLIARLSKTLLEDRKLTEKALREAVLPDEPEP